jgi:hypothetical protein
VVLCVFAHCKTSISFFGIIVNGKFLVGDFTVTSSPKENNLSEVSLTDVSIIKKLFKNIGS